MPNSICNTYPGQQGVIGVPAHVVQGAVAGWNAGANTIKMLGGDVYFQWSINHQLGSIAGIARAPRLNSSDPSNLTHAFYIRKVGGSRAALILESGVFVGPTSSVQVGQLLRIQRFFGVVEYLIGDDVPSLAVVYRSLVPSYGAVQGGGMPYASGDEIV